MKYETKKTLLTVVITCIFWILVFMLLCIIPSRKSPYTEDNFKKWLEVVYEHETGWNANKILILAWDIKPSRIDFFKDACGEEELIDDLKKVYPGYKEYNRTAPKEVMAVILTLPCWYDPPFVEPGLKEYAEATVQCAYCLYYRPVEWSYGKWSLWASSWGGGSGTRDKYTKLFYDCRLGARGWSQYYKDKYQAFLEEKERDKADK